MDAIFKIITFGVELEFIAMYKPEDYRDALLAADEKLWPDGIGNLYQKYGTLVRLRMIEFLNKNGFPTNNYEDKDFSKWTVETDGSVNPDEMGDNCAIELKTPVLEFSQDALDKVASVVELLVSDLKLYTNETCGLHVHVGNEKRGFPLSVLKNFCSLITVFENQLESLHPPDRLKNTYAKSTRMAFHSNASPTEKLSIIDRLKDTEDLVRQFSLSHDGTTKYWAYNFLNLRDDPTSLQTIEFRQHRGTLDPSLIMNWVMVVCNLVRVSFTGSRELVEMNMHNDRYTIVNLFEDLKLTSLAEFYAPRVSAVSGEGASFSERSYYTPWEKQLAPRPCRSSADVVPNTSTPAGSGQFGLALTPFENDGQDSQNDNIDW
ncbi:hypothetical protein MMC07_004430 [Pseudocyphellaria aurata]|nr:hypothetical protein [Pseudocyphellaria aurata]